MHKVKVKGILSNNNGMNLYRGCLHGCIYCDSRSKCYHMEHDFEDVEVKENALVLLENTLKTKRKKCMIGMGSMTDPYIPLEKQLQHTRNALQIINKYHFGATLITKSNLVLRDLDIIKQINDYSKCVIQITITTMDEQLCKIIEPNVSSTKERIEVLKQLQHENIPTIVWLTPILPYLNDAEENITKIIDVCHETGVKGIICFNMGLTLREGNREYFYDNLDKYFPGLKERYINKYHDSYFINSPNNTKLMKLFHQKCSEYNMMHHPDIIFKYLQTYQSNHGAKQLSLFD